MIVNRFKRLGPALAFLFFGVALYVVHLELEEYRFQQIRDAIAQTPGWVFLLALLLTAINYLTLTGYDFLALRYLGKSIPRAKVLLAAFTGFAVSNNVGHALVSGPSVRYQIYSAWGLSGWEVVRLSLFLSIMYLLGVATLGYGAYLLLPTDSLQSSGWAWAVHLVMNLSIIGLLVFWGLVLFYRKPIALRGAQFSLPSPLVALLQTLVSSADLVLASLVLYLFLRVHGDLAFGHFLLVYLLAQVLGLYSQVPGGLGVFEGSFLVLLGDSSPTEGVVAALILYRLVYYFLPLLVAGGMLLAYSWQQTKQRVSARTKVLNAILANTVPHLFALLLLLSGLILLISGATPADPDAIGWLRHWLPLPVLEISHFLGSLVGVLLLLMARAVRLRVDAAYFSSLVLLFFGVVFSLFKGFDWQEASFLGAMLLLFLPTRRFFYRKSSLLQVPLTGGWLAWVAIILAGSTWLGFFAYKHVDYGNELWWEFSYRGDASRFLRSLIAILGGLIAYAGLRLSGVHRHAPALPSEQELPELARIARQSAESRSHLALLRDKSLIFDDQHRSFLMYGTSRRYWIAMGDPVGRDEDFETLVWRFREMADKEGAKIAFYQVSDRYLPMYLDMGLVLIKLGEEALVPLAEFSLEGRKRSHLRQSFNKVNKTGVSFAILDFAEVQVAMDELQQISEHWLETKAVREKQFSLGFFDRAYLQQTRIAVVRQGERIVAFANLWETESRRELSVDLMRYDPEAGGGLMEYLLIHLMLWGKEQGYHWFNLGMAPLAGLEKHPLAPLWHKIGNLIFEHGDEFYNFEGLHNYKDKFDPVWRPCYLAAPPGLRVPNILLTVTRLVSGGTLMGAFVK